MIDIQFIDSIGSIVSSSNWRIGSIKLGFLATLTPDLEGIENPKEID